MPRGISEAEIQQALAEIEGEGMMKNVPQAKIDAAKSKVRDELEGPNVPIPPRPHP